MQGCFLLCMRNAIVNTTTLCIHEMLIVRKYIMICKNQDTDFGVFIKAYTDDSMYDLIKQPGVCAAERPGT